MGLLFGGCSTDQDSSCHFFCQSKPGAREMVAATPFGVMIGTVITNAQNIRASLTADKLGVLSDPSLC